MPRNNLAKWTALAGVTLLSTTSLLLAEPDKSQILLDLLVQRGVLKAADAAAFQQQVDAAAAAAPATPPAASLAARPAPAAPVPMEKTPKANPLAFRIGNADFSPLGFMDFTGVYRSTNTGSAIGTSFASIPYSNAATGAGQLSETKFSAQNSRLGLKIDSAVDDVKVLGYLESDFLGNNASSIGVSNNAAVLRMRVYFADLRWGAWELLAGQDWSMLTPSRKGISPLPGDIFFTGNMDTNYQAGLVWARQPQLRIMNHLSDEFTLGVSVENPDQYAGGSGGAPVIVFPTGFQTGQVDTAAATTSPNAMPDLIGKIAYDTKVMGLDWHFDAAALYRTFKVNTYGAAINSDATANGHGFSLNLNVEVAKGLHLIANGFTSKGGGRYIYGQAPDFIVTPPDANGAYGLQTLTADSYILGGEWQVAPKTLLSAYYSGIYIGRKSAMQSNGTLVGYGYTGSANSNNKDIKEYTLDVTQTIWKNPSYGALQIIGQFSNVKRDAWYVAPGAPDSATTNMFFLDFRYVLP